MTFTHKQRVAIHRRLMGVQLDGTRGWLDDWSELGTVRATKRDQRPMGYVVVQFDDGGRMCVPSERLRACA